MTTAILLYNGLHFPAGMADGGIAWALQTGGKIIALFILSDKDQEEGYPFPNDLDEAEELKTDSDAMGKDLAIISSNIRLLRHQAGTAGVPLETRIVPAATEHAIRPLLEKADRIFVSAEPLDPPVLSIALPKIKKALASVSASVEWVD